MHKGHAWKSLFMKQKKNSPTKLLHDGHAWKPWFKKLKKKKKKERKKISLLSMKNHLCICKMNFDRKTII